MDEVIGLILWSLLLLISTQTGDASFVDLIIYFFVTEGIFLGSWGVYNAYIRLARAGGKIVDYGLWFITFVLTGSYTLWSWIILDINRLILSKLLYRGEAPVEYTVSWRSKQIRKNWERAQKANHA